MKGISRLPMITGGRHNDLDARARILIDSSAGEEGAPKLPCLHGLMGPTADHQAAAALATDDAGSACQIAQVASGAWKSSIEQAQARRFSGGGWKNRAV